MKRPLRKGVCGGVESMGASRSEAVPLSKLAEHDNIDLTPTILQVGGPMSGLQGISFGRRKRRV